MRRERLEVLRNFLAGFQKCCKILLQRFGSLRNVSGAVAEGLLAGILIDCQNMAVQFVSVFGGLQNLAGDLVACKTVAATCVGSQSNPLQNLAVY